MVQQAKVRNAEAIERGVVDLRHGSVEKLPFEDSTFDAVPAINSMQVWPDVTAGLRDVKRVTRSGSRVALAFTSYSGRSRAGIPELSLGELRARTRTRGAPTTRAGSGQLLRSKSTPTLPT
jgi:ubiquinone/menaquinone biosynthesis C-methylase UbiE